MDSTIFPHRSGSLQTIIPDGTLILTHQYGEGTFETIVITKDDIEKFKIGDLEEGKESIEYTSQTAAFIGHQETVSKYLKIY